MPAALQFHNPGTHVRTILSTIALILFVGSSPALAGEWRVAPIRLDLGADARTGSVSIINEGTERINYEMKVFEWTQDASGKDVYTETSDIIFFPKILVLEGKMERVVRTGITAPPVAAEKSYRLFIEELPQPKKDTSTAVAVAVRFGIPIFVRPLRNESRGVIDPPAVSGQAISTLVRNTGTVNLNLKTIVFSGKDQAGKQTFSREASGWYLLAGASRQYSVSLSAEECRKTATVEIEAKNDKIPLLSVNAIDRTRCGP
jgi:fimbrial chaperone protein